MLGSVVLDPLFVSETMRQVVSDEARIGRWLKVEAALARAQARVGVIPEDAARLIEAACRPALIDTNDLAAETRLVGYPIAGLATSIARVAGPIGGRYVHWGATTQDIMDTATALEIREARLLIEAEIAHLSDALRDLASVHRHSVMPARTHGQHAVPTTFGFKLAVFIAELARHRQRLAAAAARAELVQLSGAAGTLASMGPVGLAVQRVMAEELQLGVPLISWHTSRDNITEFVLALALVGATVARLAAEVGCLQRTEIAEVEEAHAPGRGRSSTMPQKRNPIGAEAIIGAGLHLRSVAAGMFAAMQHENERAIGAWHAEWLALGEAELLCHGLCSNAVDLMRGLVVNPERMRRNVALTAGLINSEAVMMALAPAIGRDRAHELVYEIAMESASTGQPFLERLQRHPEVAARLTADEVSSLLDPTRYTGLAAEFVDAVLAQTS